MIRCTYVHLHQSWTSEADVVCDAAWTGFLAPRTRPVTTKPTDNRRLAAVSRPSMIWPTNKLLFLYLANPAYCM